MTANYAINSSGVSRIGGDSAACAHWTSVGMHNKLWDDARREAQLGPLMLKVARLEEIGRAHV